MYLIFPHELEISDVSLDNLILCRILHINYIKIYNILSAILIFFLVFNYIGTTTYTQTNSKHIVSYFQRKLLLAALKGYSWHLFTYGISFVGHTGFEIFLSLNGWSILDIFVPFRNSFVHQLKTL